MAKLRDTIYHPDKPLARLNDGTLVLGKVRMGWPCAITYANRTQAENAARLYHGCVVKRGRPWYVAIYSPEGCRLGSDY